MPNLKTRDNGYSPAKLKNLFDSKIEELLPYLNSSLKEQEESIRYFLEIIWKEFLYLLIMEKPKSIQLSTMNLHNFDKAILDMIRHYKFMSIEQEIEDVEHNTILEWRNLYDQVMQPDTENIKESLISSLTQKLGKSTKGLDFKQGKYKTMDEKSLNYVKGILKKKTILEVSNELVKQANQRISNIVDKNKKIEEAMKSMRFGYMKELQNYKEQLFKLEKFPESFEPVQAKYFSGLEIIDDDMKDLLNK